MDTTGKAKLNTNSNTKTSSLFTLITRSNTMKQLTVLLFTLILSVSLTFGQNIRLNKTTPASYTIGGIVNVKGNIDNSASALGVIYTFSGAVDLTGTGAQYIAGNASTVGDDKIIFVSLANSGGTAAKTMKNSIDVQTSLNIGSDGTFVVGSGNTLTITGTSAGGASVLDASGTANVTYNSGAGQTILPATYAGTLALANGGPKNVTGVVNASGTVTHSGADLAVGATGTFNYSGTSATLAGLSVAGSGVFDNTGSGTIQITTLTSNAGSIASSNSGIVRFLGAVTNGGSITTGTGTIDFNDNLNSTSSLTISSTGNLFFGGTVAATGTFTVFAGSTVTYDGAVTQNIVAPTSGGYRNLTFDGGTKNATASLALGGGSTLTGLNSAVLEMGTGAFALSAPTYALATGAKVRFGGTGHGTAIASGIVEYYGNSGTSTVALGTYARLDITGTNAATLAGATNTSADLNVGANANLIISTFALWVGNDATGDLVVEGSIDNTGGGSITVGN